MQRKAKGSVEVYDLGAITGEQALVGLELGLRHEGPGIVRRWAMMQQRWRMDEAKRVRALIAELGEAEVRALYADHLEAVETARRDQVDALEHDGQPVPEALQEPAPLARALVTLEGQEALVELQRAVVVQVAAHLGDLTDPAAMVDELERLGALSAAFVRAQEVQRLTAAQFPAAQGAGHDGRHPGAGAGA
jgi:hypothetical protein